MTGEQIFNYYRKKTENSEYARNLATFFQHAMLHGYVKEFFLMLEQAENQNKKIVHNPPAGILWEDIYLKDLSVQ